MLRFSLLPYQRIVVNNSFSLFSKTVRFSTSSPLSSSSFSLLPFSSSSLPLSSSKRWSSFLAPDATTNKIKGQFLTPTEQTTKLINKIKREERKQHISLWMELFESLGKCGDVGIADEVLDLAKNSHKIVWDVPAYTRLLNTLRKIGAYGEAEKLYQEVDQLIEENPPSPLFELELRTTAINIYGWTKEPEKAFGVFEKIISRGITPDLQLINILLHMCPSLSPLSLSKKQVDKLLEIMEKKEISPSLKTLDALFRIGFEEERREEEEGGAKEKRERREKREMFEEVERYYQWYCKMKGGPLVDSLSDLDHFEDISTSSLFLLAENSWDRHPSLSIRVGKEILSRFVSNKFPKLKIRRLLDLLTQLDQYDDVLECLQRAKKLGYPPIQLSYSGATRLNNQLQNLYDPDDFTKFRDLFPFVAESQISKKNQNLIFQLLEKSLSSNRVTEVRDLYRKLNLPQNVAYDFFSYINRNGGDSTMTFQWVSILRDAGIDIGEKTYNAMLRGCLLNGDMNYVMNILSEMEDAEIPRSVATFNLLLEHFCKKRDINKVRDIFHEMKNHHIEPDATSYILFIDGLLRCELIEEAKEVIARMQNVYEVSLLDGEFGERRREILETEPEEGGPPKREDVKLCFDKLASFYAQDGNLEGIIRVLESIERETSLSPNWETYQFLAKGLLTTVNANPHSLLTHFVSEMEERDEKEREIEGKSHYCTSSFYRNLLPVYLDLKDFDGAYWTLEKMISGDGFKISWLLHKSVVSLICQKEDKKERMKDLFEKTKDIFTHRIVPQEESLSKMANVLFSGLCDAKLEEEAKLLYESLRTEEDIILTNPTLNQLLPLFYESGMRETFDLLVEDLKRGDLEKKISFSTAEVLLKIYSQEGNQQRVSQIIDEILKHSEPPPMKIFQTLLHLKQKEAFDKLAPSLKDSPLNFIEMEIDQIGMEKGTREKLLQCYENGLTHQSEDLKTFFIKTIEAATKILSYDLVFRAYDEMIEFGYQPNSEILSKIISSLTKRPSEYTMKKALFIFQEGKKLSQKGFPSQKVLKNLELLCIKGKSKKYALLLLEDMEMRNIKPSDELISLCDLKKHKKVNKKIQRKEEKIQVQKWFGQSQIE